MANAYGIAVRVRLRALAIILFAATSSCGDHASVDAFDLLDVSGQPDADVSDQVKFDVEGPDAFEVSACVLDEFRDFFLLKQPSAESNTQLWIVLLSSGFAAGRNVTGPLADFACFELLWELEDCTEESAVIAFTSCGDTAMSTRRVEFHRTGSSSLGLPLGSLGEAEVERGTLANPSQLDDTCEAYSCLLFPDLTYLP